MVNYVLCLNSTVAEFPTDESKVVLLFKLKGPLSLRNKWTFPGGKVEAGESIEQAAAREFLEETGIDIPDADWQVVAHKSEYDYTINVCFAAMSAEQLAALKLEREGEVEPIQVFTYSQVAQMLQEASDDLVPDFYDLWRILGKIHAGL